MDVNKFFCPKCKRQSSKMQVVPDQYIAANFKEQMLIKRMPTTCLKEKLICPCGEEWSWAQLISLQVCAERGISCLR